jgi:hypothetical protein
MDDKAAVHPRDNSPEQVAYKLMLLVGLAEKKMVDSPHTTADRAWILETYSECLFAVQNPHLRSKPKG